MFPAGITLTVPISIHTLAWRVTLFYDCDDEIKLISIHTLAWRVTKMDALATMQDIISIHTLAWRVTQTPAHCLVPETHFNPHPRVEGDPIYVFKGAVFQPFQSTPSRGG